MSAAKGSSLKQIISRIFTSQLLKWLVTTLRPCHITYMLSTGKTLTMMMMVMKMDCDLRLSEFQEHSLTCTLLYVVEWPLPQLQQNFHVVATGLCPRHGVSCNWPVPHHSPLSTPPQAPGTTRTATLWQLSENSPYITFRKKNSYFNMKTIFLPKLKMRKRK